MKYQKYTTSLEYKDIDVDVESCQLFLGRNTPANGTCTRVIVLYTHLLVPARLVNPVCCGPSAFYGKNVGLEVGWIHVPLIVVKTLSHSLSFQYNLCFLKYSIMCSDCSIISLSHYSYIHKNKTSFHYLR